MATKFSSRSRSPIYLFSIFIAVAVSLLLLSFIFSSSPPLLHSSSSAFTASSASIRPETSFVVSLRNFLISRSSDDDVSNDHLAPSATVLDDAQFDRQTDRLYRGDSLYPLDLPLRVYVYQMPSKFTYDLLRLFDSTYQDTNNLTSNGSPVHRLIEQHSVDYWLWADLIAPQSERLLKSVVRVDKQEDADLFYIPFFTTISFFLLEKQDCKPLYRVKL